MEKSLVQRRNRRLGNGSKKNGDGKHSSRRSRRRKLH